MVEWWGVGTKNNTTIKQEGCGIKKRLVRLSYFSFCVASTSYNSSSLSSSSYQRSAAAAAGACDAGADGIKKS